VTKNSFIAFYVFDHLYCLINAYSSYFILFIMYFQEQTAVQLFFVYVELVSCSLVREPVSEYKMAAS